MSLKTLLLAAPFALNSWVSYWDQWNKVWEYTCKVQKGASDVLTNPSSVIVWNKVFATDPDIHSRFENYDVKYRLPNRFNETWGLEIYFISNQASLDNWDKTDLDQVVKQINSMWVNINILLEWYADARWSEKANKRIATKRIESVKEYISSQLNEWIEVSFEYASFWETRTQKNTSWLTKKELLELGSDRKVVVSISGNTITAWLDRSPADAYILDASGSMNEVMTDWETRWSALTSYSFPEDSSIFTFTTDHSDYGENDCSDLLIEQKVEWTTPMFDSVLNVMNTGEFDWKTITVLSDGEDNESKNTMWTVIKVAVQRNITINVIWIWTANKVTLRNIAESTGWKYTFQN